MKRARLLSWCGAALVASLVLVLLQDRWAGPTAEAAAALAAPARVPGAAHGAAREGVAAAAEGALRLAMADAFPGDARHVLGSPSEAEAAQDLRTAEVTPEELQAFRDYVDANLRELRREEAAVALERLAEATERLQRTFPALASWLVLTPRQSARLKAALLARKELEAYYLRQWEHGADAATLKLLKASDREAHLAEVRAILRPKQFERYLSGEGRRWR